MRKSFIAGILFAVLVSPALGNPAPIDPFDSQRLEWITVCFCSGPIMGDDEGVEFNRCLSLENGEFQCLP